jgi:DNA-binding protein YbaB
MVDVEANLGAITALAAELEHTLFTGRAANDTVVAVVRGSGDVVEIRVADAALRQGHPAAIGPAVVAALTQARTTAGQVTRQRLAEILGAVPGMPVAERPGTITPVPSRGSGPRPRSRRPRPVEQDEPDLFTGLQGGF